MPLDHLQAVAYASLDLEDILLQNYVRLGGSLVGHSLKEKAVRSIPSCGRVDPSSWECLLPQSLVLLCSICL